MGEDTFNSSFTDAGITVVEKLKSLRNLLRLRPQHENLWLDLDYLHLQGCHLSFASVVVKFTCSPQQRSKEARIASQLILGDV